MTRWGPGGCFGAKLITTGSSSAYVISCQLSSSEEACWALLPCTNDLPLAFVWPEEVGVVVGHVVGVVVGGGVVEIVLNLPTLHQMNSDCNTNKLNICHCFYLLSSKHLNTHVALFQLWQTQTSKIASAQCALENINDNDVFASINSVSISTIDRVMRRHQLTLK